MKKHRNVAKIIEIVANVIMNLVVIVAFIFFNVVPIVAWGTITFESLLITGAFVLHFISIVKLSFVKHRLKAAERTIVELEEKIDNDHQILMEICNTSSDGR